MDNLNRAPILDLNSKETQKTPIKSKEQIISEGDGKYLVENKDLNLDKEIKKDEKIILEERKKVEQEKESFNKFEKDLLFAFNDLNQKSKIMLDALYERMERRFTPLQSPDEFNYIVDTLKSLKNSTEIFNSEELEKINKKISRISEIFANMGPRNSGGSINEDPENLQKLSFGVKQFSSSAQEAIKNINLETNDENLKQKVNELKKILNTLSENLQKVNNTALRLADSIRRF